MPVPLTVTVPVPPLPLPMPPLLPPLPLTPTPTPTLTPTQLLVSRDASADAAKLMRDAVAQRIAGGHGLAGLCPDPKKLC